MANRNTASVTPWLVCDIRDDESRFYVGNFTSWIDEVAVDSYVASFIKVDGTSEQFLGSRDGVIGWMMEKGVPKDQATDIVGDAKIGP